MKKYLLIIPAMLMSVIMQAQTVLTIETKKGKNFTYTVGTDADSIRIIEGVGIKVYPKNTKVSKDYLMSQIKYTLITGNANKNTEADLAKNKEGWRLEFPRFYQGNNVTYEKSYYITDMNGSPVNFSIEWDGTKRANRWTCYQMYEDVALKNGDRKDAFMPDTDIPAEYRSELKDYSKSGYSRGHLCPSNDRVCSSIANKQTFYLTNMQPQVQGHNGGVWSQLEQRIKNGWFYQNGTKIKRCDTLYIVKAATIDSEANIIGYTKKNESNVNHLIIPKYFYMALLSYNCTTKKYEAMGIWSPHQEKGSITEYITIDELEKRTGIDFFCNLPDDVEDDVESKLDSDYWEVSSSKKQRNSSAKNDNIITQEE